MRRDDGFVTGFVLGLLMLLLGVSAAVTGLGVAAVTRHRAAAAADLAALAAAAHALEGERVACAAAARVASRQGAVLRGCRLEGLDVRVQVSVRAPGWLAQLGSATGVAAAGPRR